MSCGPACQSPDVRYACCSESTSGDSVKDSRSGVVSFGQRPSTTCASSRCSFVRLGSAKLSTHSIALATPGVMGTLNGRLRDRWHFRLHLLWRLRERLA